MRNKDSIFSTFLVVITVSLVCSLLVAIAAVVLQKRQLRNAALEKQFNIVKAAGLYEEGKPIDELYQAVEAKVINRETGDFSEMNPDDFNVNEAFAKDDLSTALSADADIAGLGRMPNDLKVYLLKKDDKIEKVILPFRGKGLWGMMYGFLAMKSDGETISGITFYEHKETPGLGGEIVNPQWQNMWVDKKPYSDGKAAIQLAKTMSETPDVVEHQIDMLAGATLTSRGVENTVNFWLGEHGYKPFLAKLSQ